MIEGVRLFYEFDRRFHHRNSSYSKALSAEDVCSFLTEGLMIYFENRVAVAETSSLVQNDLRNYEVKEVELPIVKEEKDFVVASYMDNHYQLLNQKACASKEGCPSGDIGIRIFQSDDKRSALVNEMMKPSFEWRETVGEEGEDGLYVWHNREFKIDKILVDYYRKPEDIHVPSMKEGTYVDWNGVVRTEDTVLDMPTYAFRKIVDIAILCATRDIGDLKDFQSQINKIVNTDKIHL